MKRLRSLAAASAGLMLAVACDLGPDVSGVELPTAVPIALAPAFSVAPTEEEIAALDRLRVTLRRVGDSTLVEQKELDIGPADDGWEIPLRVPAGVDLGTAFFVEAELADVKDGGESVEWSGSTDAFSLQAADRPIERRLVLLYRGPLANLRLTDVSLSRPSLRIVDGATSTLQVTAEGEQTGTVLFFSSADTSVAAVVPSGIVQSNGIGDTKVYVVAGTVGDSVQVEVGHLTLPTESEVDAMLSPSLEYVASDLFISTLHDPSGADSVRTQFADLRSRLQQRDEQGVVAAFEAAKAAWQTYGAGTTLRTVDEPQLGVLELTLHRVAVALDTAFP